MCLSFLVSLTIHHPPPTSTTLEDCSGDDRFAGVGERDNCCSDIVFCYGVRCAFRCYSTECEIRIDSGMHFHLHNTIIGMSGSTLQYFPM